MMAGAATISPQGNLEVLTSKTRVEGDHIPNIIGWLFISSFLLAGSPCQVVSQEAFKEEV